MTAWIVGKTDRFRAAVSQNPRRQLDQQDADRRQLVRLLLLQPLRGAAVGVSGAILAVFAAFSGRERDHADDESSPARRTSGRRCPSPTRCFTQLKMRGIDTAVIRLPGASHDMSRRPSQLMAKIANIVAWFEKYRVTPAAS